jgi:energy-coupling factor transporter ATP-binding protein EcfA2
MELFSFTLQGHRRFKDQCTLRTNGKLVALIGPNESGKTTLIDALDDFDRDEPTKPAEFSRGRPQDKWRVTCKFLLNDEELTLAGLTGPRWIVVTKSADGKKRFGFVPPCPDRDTDHRDVAAKHILSILDDKQFRAKLDESDPELGKAVEQLIADLLNAPVNLPSKVLSELSRLYEAFDSELSDEDSKPVSLALNAWSEMLVLERAASPTNRAIEQLRDKAPEFLFFDDDDRQLESTYDITALRTEIPLALDNLLDVAELSISELFGAIDVADGAAIATLEHRANATLKKRFLESWQQSGVSVALRLSPTLLEVQVVNEASEFSALAERSDGLRQFVALHAFVLCKRSSAPILLIDEAEHRLHYDAQADLVQMLAKQEIAAKVIYSTHSAGCLPEDLGNGVRLVRPKADDETASQIVNKFWADAGDGFMPLLIGLGASTLAFFPTRRAILVEGPVDMLLYPTLFREVTQADHLGFQFVPGLATNGQVLAPIVRQANSHIGYLTDGDEGGTAIADQLEAAGIDRARIVRLKNSDGSAVEIEDFVDPAILLAAANKLIHLFHPGADGLMKEQLSVARRMSSLEVAYLATTGMPLPKIELAYEILNAIDETPGKPVLDARRRKAFSKVVDRVTSLFGGAPILPQ